MNMPLLDRYFWLHIGVIVALLALLYVLPDYHSGIMARVMVLVIYALGYNLLLGYTGLLSLGHALYFAAGMYGAGLVIRWLDWSLFPALLAGIVASALVALLIGSLALRTIGVAFMIVTMMFAQAGYLLILYFNDYTRGDEGFVIDSAARLIHWGSTTVDLSLSDNRYLAAWCVLSACLLIKLWLVRSGTGRVWIGLRENEERARLLGFNPYRYKLAAFIVSGIYAGTAGALYAILFGYAGATFASIQYSILPLLWVLLGGAGVVLGPVLGTIVMFYLVDFLSEQTSAYMLFVGIVLVLLVLIAPRGILGSLRRRFFHEMP